MTTRTARAWLAAALTAVVLLPMQALADWRDASGYLSVTQSARAFDRTNRQIYSYVTITNTATNAQGQPVAGAVTGPLRLVIPTSNFGVVGEDGTTDASEPYVDLPASVSLDQGESVTVRVNFALLRGALSFTTRPERWGTTAPTITMPATAIEGGTVHGTMDLGGGSGTFAWTQLPGGPSVVISGANTDSMTFTAPHTSGVPQVLTFEGTVTDPQGVVTTATQSITIQPDNIWVDAGKSRSVGEGQTIHLSARGAGSGSGPDVFTWVQQSPATPTVTLTNAGTDNPSFVTPTVTDRTTFVFEVTFTDGLGTATDTVAVTVEPPPTVAANTPLTLPGATQQQPLVVVVQPAAEVPAGSVQQLSAVASGGDGHYTWKWKTPVPSTTDPLCKTTEGPDNAQIFEVTLPSACPEQNVTYKIRVDVTDGQGQFAAQDTNLWVNVPSGIPVEVYAPTVATSEGPLPVTIGATATGGTGPYTYAWTQTGGPSVTLTGPDTAQPSFVPPAVDADTTLTFRVTATDSASGSAIRDMNVLVRNAFALTPPQLLTLQVPPTVEILAGDSIALAATASGGTGPYTWQWQQTGGTAAALTGDTTDTVSVTPASGPDTLTLQVTVTDSAVTPVVKQATVQVDVLGAPSGVPLSVPAIPKQYVDEGLANVGITAGPRGGTGPYTYSWAFIPSGGLTSLTLTDATTNVVRFNAPQVSAQTMLQFRVTVTDNASPAATATRDAYVVVNDITPPLVLNLTGPELSAHSGHTVTLGVGPARGGQGPYTYVWTQTAGTPTVVLTNNGDGTATFTAPTVTSGTTVPLSFELTVTDAAGSVQHATQRVVVDQGMQIASLTCPTGTVTAGSDLTATVAMAGGSTPVAATTPLTYTWTTQAPALGGLPNAATFTKLVPATTTAGTMTVSVEVRDSSSPPQVKTQSCSVTIGAAATITKPGSWCLICGDEASKTPCNDLDLVLGVTQKCPDDKPYCMNDVIQRGADIKEYRRCIRRGDAKLELTTAQVAAAGGPSCDSLWYRATSDDPLCLPFNPNSQEDNLICHLCCYGDPNQYGPGKPLGEACNMDTNPPDNTLYRP